MLFSVILEKDRFETQTPQMNIFWKKVVKIVWKSYLPK